MTDQHACLTVRPLYRLLIDNVDAPVLTVRAASRVVDATSDQTRIVFPRDFEADNDLEQKLRHDLKNESAAMKVGLAVLKQCLAQDDTAQAAEFLESLLEQADRLDEQIEAYSAARGGHGDDVCEVVAEEARRFGADDNDSAAVQRILFLSSDRATREAFCDLCAGSSFSAVATDDADDALAWLGRQDAVAGIFCEADCAATPRVLQALADRGTMMPPTCELSGISPATLDDESPNVRSAFVDAIGLACRLA